MNDLARLLPLPSNDIMNGEFKHQFYQYQQNEQPPLILTELTENKKTHDM